MAGSFVLDMQSDEYADGKEQINEKFCFNPVCLFSEQSGDYFLCVTTIEWHYDI